jgi:hypothetical protein
MIGAVSRTAFDNRDISVHLAFRGPDSMSLSWQLPSIVGCDRVFYGRSQNSLILNATAERTCSIYKGDTMRHSIIRGLEPAIKYYYRIECSNTIDSFMTALPWDHNTESFTFGVYADLGIVNGEASLARLASLNLVGHIFAGDIGYADDAFLHGQGYISRLNEFMRAISRVSGSTPVMVAPGNHEAEDHTPVCLLSPDCRSGLGNFTAYNCVWDMPNAGRGHQMWHSFDYGPIHFVMINTETDYEGAPMEKYGEVGFIPTGSFGAPGEFTEWLRADLLEAESERWMRPFIIVAGHRPISVLDGENSDPFKTPLSDEIIGLIKTHADAYIAGHVHYYARSSPLPSNPLKAQLITVGGAGCDEWSVRHVQDTRSGRTDGYDFFGYGDEQTVGLLKFDANSPDELRFEAIRSRDGGVVDTVVIPKRVSSGNGQAPIIVSE